MRDSEGIALRVAAASPSPHALTNGEHYSGSRRTLKVAMFDPT